MSRFNCFIVLILVIGCGCRSRKETHGVSRSDLQYAASLEARHLDSVFLSTSIGYRLNIDFFPPDDSAMTRADSGSHLVHGAVRRVTVETGQKTAVAHTVVDSVSAKETRAESDFKSVDASVERNKGTLPLLVGIIALIVALCCLITYKIRK